MIWFAWSCESGFAGFAAMSTFKPSPRCSEPPRSRAHSLRLTVKVSVLEGFAGRSGAESATRPKPPATVLTLRCGSLVDSDAGGHCGAWPEPGCDDGERGTLGTLTSYSSRPMSM